MKGLSDLAFNEGPFLDQQYDDGPNAFASASKGLNKHQDNAKSSKARKEIERDDSPEEHSQHEREASAEIDYAPRPSLKARLKALPWMAPEYAPPPATRTAIGSGSVQVYAANKRLSSSPDRPPAPVRSPARHSPRSKATSFSYRDHSIVAENRADFPSSDFDGLSAASLARRRAEAKQPSEPSIARTAKPLANTSKLPPEPEVVDHGQYAKAGAAFVPLKPSKAKVEDRKATAVRASSLPSNKEMSVSPHPLAPPYVPFDTGLEGLEEFDPDFQQAQVGSSAIRDKRDLQRPSHLFGLPEPDTAQPKKFVPAKRAVHADIHYAGPVQEDLPAARQSVSDIYDAPLSADPLDITMQFQHAQSPSSSNPIQQWQADHNSVQEAVQYGYTNETTFDMPHDQSMQANSLDIDAMERTLAFQADFPQKVNPASHAWLFSFPADEPCATSHRQDDNHTYGLSSDDPHQGALRPMTAAAMLGLDIGPAQDPEPLESRISGFWKQNRP